MPATPRKIFVPLSSFWFLYLGAAGITFPFYALYLSDNARLSGTEVGLVVTMPPLVGFFAPALWGRLADRAQSRTRVLAAGVAGTAILTAAIGLLRGFPALLAGTAVAAFFSTGAIPMALAVSFAALGDSANESFGRIRVWGTVGFFIMVVVFPIVFHGCRTLLGVERVPGGPAEPGLEWMFLVAGLVNLAAAAGALLIPMSEGPRRPGVRGGWRELQSAHAFRRALLFAFFTALCLQGPMSLFPVYVRARGGGLDALSHLWIIMLVPEVLLVGFAGTGFRRLGARGLLASGVLATALRWLVCGLSDDPRLIYPVQALHGIWVVGLGVGGPLYVESSVPGRLRGTAQGLYAMAGAGVGGMISNVAAGWLIDQIGPRAPFVVGGLGGLVLAASIPLLLPPPERPAEFRVDETAPTGG